MFELPMSLNKPKCKRQGKVHPTTGQEDPEEKQRWDISLIFVYHGAR
jgi:hypothetical protein